MRVQCNNPMTKEPKLTGAMRIVPEWTDYDQEIRQLQDRSVTVDSAPAGGEQHSGEAVLSWLLKSFAGAIVHAIHRKENGHKFTKCRWKASTCLKFFYNIQESDFCSGCLYDWVGVRKGNAIGKNCSFGGHSQFAR